MQESNFFNLTTESAPTVPISTTFDNQTDDFSINSTTAWPAFTSPADESSTIFTSEETSTTSAGTVADVEIDFWHKTFIGSIANAIRLVQLLVDNSDKLLVYLIVSVTGCLIILLLGLTVKMIVNKNSRRHVKRRRSASDSSPQSHGRLSRAAASSRQFAETPSQRRQHETNSNRKHAGHRAHYGHNGHKLSKLAGEMSGPTHYASRMVNTRGFDRVRNQEYTPVSTSENPSRMSTMQLQSHSNDGRAPRSANSACATSNFSQNVSDFTRPILQGEIIPSQSFHVVRFKPQLLASKINNSPIVPTSYAGDFDDFDD